MTPRQSENSHNRQTRTSNRRALLLALAILTLFLVAELVVGLIANSLALVADAAHILSDIGALLLALLAFRFALRPPSTRRSYGYYRLEILAALVNGLTLWLIAAYIFYEAAKRFQSLPEVQGVPVLIVATLGFMGQAVAAAVLRRAAGESLNVKGAYLHIMTDAVQSIGVIATGLVIVLFRWYLADPIVSILVGVLIIYSGGRIVLEAVHILLEGTPASLDPKQVEGTLMAVEGVGQVHDLHIWALTSGYHVMSAHVVLDRPREGTYLEELRRRLREILSSRFSIQHLTIQIEESARGCGERDLPRD